MVEEEFCCIKQGGEVISDDIPNEVCVDVKVAVCYVIAHTNDFSPGNIWSMGKQLSGSPFIYVPESFAYCFD